MSITERSYIYDSDGRVSVRRTKMGALRSEMNMIYNDRGDPTIMVLTHAGAPDPRMRLQNQTFEVRYT